VQKHAWKSFVTTRCGYCGQNTFQVARPPRRINIELPSPSPSRTATGRFPSITEVGVSANDPTKNRLRSVIGIDINTTLTLNRSNHDLIHFRSPRERVLAFPPFHVVNTTGNRAEGSRFRIRRPFRSHPGDRPSASIAITVAGA